MFALDGLEFHGDGRSEAERDDDFAEGGQIDVLRQPAWRNVLVHDALGKCE